MSTANPTSFGSLLRHWREQRRYSQLDLALEADVSSKHVSFLETGRNRPSREMIVRLSNAMDVPSPRCGVAMGTARLALCASP